jgi:S-adenosylmethionine:tRNA ribosyltransferase-isomerase
MRLSDFDFDLPEGLIATRPARPRSSARLLVATPDAIDDLHVSNLPGVLRPGDRLVLNDTKVIPARLSGVRRRGEAEARIEATLLADRGEGLWAALLKPLRKVREGEVIDFGDGLSARFEGSEEGQGLLRFALSPDAFAVALAQAGRMPLPPYIEALRPADDGDREDYQTVWGRREGAVAAPTASLHFDEPLLAVLRDRGVAFTHVTLHVGAGTFLPVKVDHVSEHRMHAEWGEVTEEAAEEIAATRAQGGRIVPVGTTAMRLLESAGQDGTVRPWRGETDIFITPGFPFRACDGLMTNFHLPKSTLMMLVSAFLGTERIREVYAHAIREGYRLFSYGDASLLLPKGR